MEIPTAGQIEDYLCEQLDRLIQRKPKIQDFKRIEDYAYSVLTRATYRDHSISPSYANVIKTVVRNAFDENAPIKVVCPMGGYKLWKLPAAPFADWAELFFLMHKVNWLKPLLEVYKPGVEFDFFSDGVIIPTLNNIPEVDIVNYEVSFKNILNALSPFLPSNITFTLHTMLDLYPNRETILFEFQENYKDLLQQEKFEPLKFSEQEKKSARANIKTDHELTELELHQLLVRHQAYASCIRRRPYYRNREKIFVGFTPVLEALPLKSTRTSSLRFWLGTGYLKDINDEDAFIEGIMSPSVHAKANITKIGINLKGISQLKNFDNIDFLL